MNHHIEIVSNKGALKHEKDDHKFTKAKIGIFISLRMKQKILFDDKITCFVHFLLYIINKNLILRVSFFRNSSVFLACYFLELICGQL